VLMGLLRPLLDSVNMVNAPVIARERDIEIAETKRERASDYQTLIRVIVDTEQRERSLTGTLFGGEKPRIVGIEDVPIEAEVSSHMLFIRNEDKPGFIGHLGTTLGDAGVNVATFHLGRTAPGENAIALVSVDQRISDELLHKIGALPSVVRAKALSF
jgi:D-3-phosphoglycerate dehydrogenase